MSPTSHPRRGPGVYVIYALLLIGSAIFVWPFLWMATTSVKLDREMFGETIPLWPQQPVPRVKSPYIDERWFRDVSGPRMEELLPKIQEHISSMDFPWPEDVDRAAAIPQTARGVYKKLTTVLPLEAWKLPPAELADQALKRVDAPMVREALEETRRHFSIGRLLARSYDLQEDTLVSPEEVARAWQVETPGGAKAELVPVRDPDEPAADLRYDFSGGDTVRLSQTFSTSFPIARLHRIQLSMRNDDTWHAATLYVEKLGRRYKAARPVFLFDLNWLTTTWQEPGPEDQTNKIKSWILLHEEPAGGGVVESDPHKIKLTLELKKNTTLGAWGAKIWRNYQETFNQVPFWRYVATSLFLVVLNVVLTLFSCSLVAYSFARLQWPGRGFCFALMLATMMIPSQVTMIPHFLIIRSLGWYNTLYPLWVPNLFATAFNVFLLRQFLKGIPRDLEDAARIDGCGFLRVYWHLMLPLVRPTLAAIAIFTFMATWNDFMGPLVYLSDQRLYPLSLGLFALGVQTGGGASSMGIMMAGSLLMTLPVIGIFFFAQRYFLQGVTLTGMKG